MDEELKARIYALPTRAELELMFDRFVTKEVFNIQLGNIRDEIDTLKRHPEVKANRAVAVATVVSVIVNVAGIVLAHLAWR